MSLHPTRRTVVRTAAWSVPAVAVTTAAPARAASVGATITVVSSAGDRTGSGSIVVALDPAPSGTPAPAVTYDDPGATSGTFSPSGTSGSAALYTLAFSTTTTPVPATIGVTVALAGYGNTSTTVTMPQPGMLDTRFPDPRLSGAVRSALPARDGKLIVSGDFTAVGSPAVTRSRLARLNAGGSLDSSFADPGVGNFAYFAREQADGKVVVGGAFTTAGVPAVARGRVARFNSDGTLDTSFADPQVNGVVNVVLLQPDGKVLAGGNFTWLGASGAATARGRLCRLNADGTLDTTFADPNISSAVNSLELQADGKVLVGGAFTGAGAVRSRRNRLARFNVDGTLDTSFVGPGLSNSVHVTVTQPDGKILVGGEFTSVDGSARNRLCRLNVDGTLDTTFADPGLNALVYGILVQPDGRIVVTGGFTAAGGATRRRLCRLNADGTLDTTFADPALSNVGLWLTAAPDDTVLVAGGFTTVGPDATPQAYLARILL
ncbi:hypothetical protein [Nocardioides zeae]